MRRLLTLSLLFLATSGFAKDIYLSIGGTANAFHSDMRIFNPSATKDIQVQIFMLAPGNVDNTAAQSTTITVPKRQMLVSNDVLTTLFSATGIAGIRLSSSDDFVVTERIFATSSRGCTGGTTGQFVPGLDAGSAVKQGVLLQLKANGIPGDNGTYRTNIGVANPNSVAANVTWRLYDKNNSLIGSPKTIQYLPFGVQGPTPLSSFADNLPATADLSDSWLSYVSDQPLFAYASVVDNITDDGTLITGAVDSGVAIQTGGLTFNVLEKNFSITISPAPSTLAIGDVVTFHITVQESNHGFELDDPNGIAVIPSSIFSPGQVVDKTFTVRKNGMYNYFCTNLNCGAHTGMAGSFDVGQPSGDPQPHY
jgi:plastocyanin